MAPVPSFLRILRGWLWHEEHATDRALLVLLADQLQQLEFRQFVLGLIRERNASGTRTCPLGNVPGCGPTGHTYDDMVAWVPPFAMSVMMLYGSSWAKTIDKQSPLLEWMSA
ncbi:hypothetical protein L209DRAFT_751283 [Thermothelomyces heterothallicus CBS 203.75]